MKRTIAWAVSAAALAIGCGSVVVEPNQTADATSGSGGATTSSTTTSIATSSGGGSIDVTTSTGTGGGSACGDATVFIDVLSDEGNDHFDVTCAPVGNIDYGGGPGAPPPPPGPPPAPSAGLLFIHGCAAKSNYGIELRTDWMMFPGSSSQVQITYWLDGVEYHSLFADGAALEVTQLDPTGGVIEGTFSGNLTPSLAGNGPPTLMITGKFRICHGMDFSTV